MRTLATLSSLLLLAGLAAAPAYAAPRPTPAAPTVETLGARYLDGLFRAKPHLATFMGEHKYDGKLPDHSASALRAREKELVALQKLVASAATPTADAAIDKQILSDGIALELLYLREIRDWEWDPRLGDSFPYYDPREIVAGRLSDIIHGDFAPEAARHQSVNAELAALPRYLATEMAALSSGKRHPAKVMLDQAIKGNTGRIEFFQTEVKAFTAKDPAGEKARVKAVAALEKFQKFLETKLTARADGDWRLGADLYGKKFPLALQTQLTPDEVVPRAEKAFAAAKQRLYAVARKLHAELWPKEKQPAANATAEIQKKTIERVKEALSKDHAKPDDLVAAHGRNLDKLRAFIVKHDLLALPPPETLTVEPMPAFKRGSSAAEYLAPGVLSPQASWKATYFIDPIDPTWPADKVESYLRGQNDYEVQLVAAHEAYPGHHTQYSYAKQQLDPVRAVLWNAPMVEGWAVYGEGLMVALGWGDRANARFEFYDLRGQMIVATNALLDIKLQSGKMTDEEAVKFMVEEGFQEQAMAEKKLLRAKLDSTQLVQYFLGLSEIQDLERDYRAQVGQKFVQRTFDEALIGHGSIAVKFLRQLLLAPAAKP
ncbi:MAG: DUF885 domain-containing protein [Deltaproteobacteria bacterium]|nr:DUF885 domain-containing protein [Deltaproteobacteria bacterium]